MPSLVSMQVQCPVCRNGFVTQIEQIVDVGADPAAKQRLLSGQLNRAVCPKCGNGGMLDAPLLYHDPAHQMLLTYMPMELDLPPQQREQMIGGLTRELMTRIPAEARKGYLFNPQPVLTIDGLVERVLAAEGVPAEVLELQKRQSRLLARLMAAADAEIEPLAKEHDGDLDEGFFQMLAMAEESARRSARESEAQAFVRLRNRLLPLATWSRERGITPQALDAQQERLDLVGQLLTAEESDLPELVQVNDKKLDYLFFQLLTALAEEAEPEIATRLSRLRERLMELSSAGQAARSGQDAVEKLRSAAQAKGQLTRELLLDQILQAENEAAEEALAVAASSLLDYSFFILMADRIEAAEKTNRADEAAKLSALRGRLVTVTEERERARQADLERVNQQIQELLVAESQSEAIRRLLPEIDEFFLSVLFSQIEASRKEKSAGGLTALLNAILGQIKSSAPPEIQLVNDLIVLEDDSAMAKMLDKRWDEVTAEFLTMIGVLVQDMRSSGRTRLAERMETLHRMVADRLGSSAHPGAPEAI